MPKEYAELWIDLFRPFLDCGDWFMSPYSFVMNIDHIYYNRNSKAVSYVYIPSTQRFSGYAELKELAADISRFISVTDADLENKVLRAIMKDFNPTDFLKMLKTHLALNTPSVASWLAPAPMTANSLLPPVPAAELRAATMQEPQYNTTGEYRMTEPFATTAGASVARPQLPIIQHSEILSYKRAATDPRDIIINIPENGKSAKKSKDNAKAKEISNRKKEKGLNKTKGTSSILGRYKNSMHEMDAVRAPVPPPNYLSAQNLMQVYIPSGDPIDVMQRMPTELNGALLRLVGSVQLPQIISIRITTGEVFTVGRFDAAIGRKQSSFEFDKKTKSISRRHAVIERHAGGYNIIDLSSSAGTFLNGDKLPPNTPRELYHGCRVSFGNAGADYVWESA
jgi:hypothetical protein